jgi:hypothetical protein
MVAVKIFMRAMACLGGGLFLLAISARCFAQAQPGPADAETYVAPAGKAPPVAPPLKKGSPLDHLVNDPKYTALPAGYREGNTSGDTYWIAHRHIDEMDGQGWGWIRKSSDDWDDAKWIALQETPGLAIAPRRRFVVPAADNDWEFKFWGTLTGYKAYDPRLDELLPVFVLKGYEVLGPANPLRNKIGPPDRIQHRPSGASSRSNRPILTDPGVD